MNEIATITPQRSALQAGAPVAGIVPRTLEDAFRLSQAIHQSGMAPYGLDSSEKVMIAMMSGLELGMPPMQAVQSIAVINNRPCMWGDALIGVIRSYPQCEWIREWIDGSGDDMTAHCETKRRGEVDPVSRSFSVDDAKRAGLWQTEARVTKNSRNGGTYEKDNDSPWYRYPKRMLQMRARAWCLRDTYADILKGMQVREEVEDYRSDQPATQAQSPGLQARLAAKKPASGEIVEGFQPNTETVATPSATDNGTVATTEDMGSGADNSNDEAGEEGAASSASATPSSSRHADQAAPVNTPQQAGAAQNDGLTTRQKVLIATSLLWPAETAVRDGDKTGEEVINRVATALEREHGNAARPFIVAVFNRAISIVRDPQKIKEVRELIAAQIGVEPEELMEQP